MVVREFSLALLFHIKLAFYSVERILTGGYSQADTLGQTIIVNEARSGLSCPSWNQSVTLTTASWTTMRRQLSWWK